jgi:hypothetical protein
LHKPGLNFQHFLMKNVNWRRRLISRGWIALAAARRISHARRDG